MKHGGLDEIIRTGHAPGLALDLPNQWAEERRGIARVTRHDTPPSPQPKQPTEPEKQFRDKLGQLISLY